MSCWIWTVTGLIRTIWNWWSLAFVLVSESEKKSIRFYCIRYYLNSSRTECIDLWLTQIEVDYALKCFQEFLLDEVLWINWRRESLINTAQSFKTKMKDDTTTSTEFKISVNRNDWETSRFFLGCCWNRLSIKN